MRPSKKDLQELAARDPLLGDAMGSVEPFPGFPEGTAHARRTYFHSLVRSIIYQMLTAKAAGTIYSRFDSLSPRGFPTPKLIAALSTDEIRKVGVSRSKANAIRELAIRITSRELNLCALSRRADAEIIDELTRVRGIGVWTVQMFLIFRLGRLDVMPLNDVGIQEGIRRLDGLETRPSPSEVRARAACWSPYASIASWVLWQLADGEDWT